MQWNVIRLRKEAGLTQVDMAKLLGISRDAYALKETGKNRFKDNEMFMLRDIVRASTETKITMDEIFLPPNSIYSEVK